MINDMHCHVHEFSDFEIKLSETQRINYLMCINPFIKELHCNVDKNHYCFITNRNKKMCVFCTNCNKIVRIYDDVFFDENYKLFQQMNKKENINIFATLPVLAKGMNLLSEKYIKLFKTELKGFKLYTGLSEIDLNHSEFLESDLPLLIHTGTYQNQLPYNMIDFLRFYRGKIILAHFCRLDMETINYVKKLDNIFFDVSPSYEIFQRYKKNKNVLLCKDTVNNVLQMYKKLINTVGEDKILWGSDAPFSSFEKELNLFWNLNLKDNIKEKILTYNSKNFWEEK